MTVDEFVRHLNELQKQGQGQLKLLAVHGASGAPDPISYPSVHQADDLEAEILGIEEGGDYVSVYIGN
jgi:hypothetical protein